MAQLIRGKSAQVALIDLEFAHRRMSIDVKKVLEAAIANAENNHNLDVDRLFVREAIVGKTLVMGRFHARGRGRSAAIEKPFSNISITVEERSTEDAPKKADKKTAKKGAESAKATEGKAKAKKAPAAKKETSKE